MRLFSSSVFLTVDLDINLCEHCMTCYLHNVQSIMVKIKCTICKNYLKFENNHQLLNSLGIVHLINYFSKNI